MRRLGGDDTRDAALTAAATPAGERRSVGGVDARTNLNGTWNDLLYTDGNPYVCRFTP